MSSNWYYLYASIDYTHSTYYFDVYDPSLEDNVNFHFASQPIRGTLTYSFAIPVYIDSTYLYLGSSKYSEQQPFCGSIDEFILIINYVLQNDIYRWYFRNGITCNNIYFNSHM